MLDVILFSGLGLFVLSAALLWRNGVKPAVLFVCVFSGTLAVIALGFSFTASSGSSVESSSTIPEAPTTAVHAAVLEGPLKELNANCLACHGGVCDGKKVIKGGFDIAPLLNDGIVPRHSTDWATVVKMIREKEMPPADSNFSLADSVREEIATTVIARLDRKAIPERVMTATEIRNTVSQLFAFNTGVHDPFEKLAFVKVPDARYETVDAARLMSAAYLRELDAGLTATLTNVPGRGFEKIGMHRGKPVTSWNLYFDDNRLLRAAPVYLANVEGPMKAEAVLNAQMRKVFEIKDQAERRRQIDALKKKIRALYDKKAGRPVEVDLRIRDPEPLWASSTRNIAPGRYRLTFKAKGINRDLVGQSFAAAAAVRGGKKNKWDANNRVWAELLHNKMQLQVQWHGVSKGNRGTLIAGAKNGDPLANFTIEDKVEREFSCEMRSTVPFRLGVSWLNGPVNSRLERLLARYSGAAGQSGNGLQASGDPYHQRHSSGETERLATPHSLRIGRRCE